MMLEAWHASAVIFSPYDILQFKASWKMAPAEREGGEGTDVEVRLRINISLSVSIPACFAV